MRHAGAVLGLACLLVLGGCLGIGGEETPGASPTPTIDGPDTPTTDGTPPRTGTADNPFGQAVVPVRINESVSDDRNTTAIVATAIDYWNARIDRHTAFDYRFVLAEDPADARVEVRFVDEIRECGRDHTERTVGCAPLYEEGSTAPDVAVARIEYHGSRSAVTGTVQHELGHVLGLRHDDEPHRTMAFGLEEPVRDATERALPWYREDLLVYVDHASIDGDQELIDDQIGHALAYYDDGAEGTIPDNVTYRRTDHEPSADIVITNGNEYDCSADGGSTMSLQGPYRLDNDDEIELYTRQVICLDVDDDATAWHVGKWLGSGMGLSDAELADPFQDASYLDRRSEWWD